MGKCQRRLRFVLIGKYGHLIEYVDQFPAHQLQRFRHNNDIRVVSHIAGGGAEMDNTFRLRTLDTICVDMGHNIVTHQLLSLFCHFKINLVLVLLQFVNLFLCDRKA